MPKIVNHSLIKERISAAAWRVLLREGMRGFSVRAIAQELQLSVGMIRHYFPKQEGLLLFSMELVVQQVRERLRSVDPLYTSQEKLRYAALQFLPLDKERAVEMEVWLQFVTGARNAQMADIRAEAQMSIQMYLANLIMNLWQDAGIDLPVENAQENAKALHALLDGLTLRCMALPGEQAQQEAVAILDRQLSGLEKRGPV
jgi:AcrR family transcriptional regulator